MQPEREGSRITMPFKESDSTDATQFHLKSTNGVIYVQKGGRCASKIRNDQQAPSIQ